MGTTVTSKPPPGKPSMDRPVAPPVQARGTARAELLLRRHVKSGWLCIAIGVIVPILALGGAFYGVRVRLFGRPGMGSALIVVGFTVFLARLILYLG
jgi:hypothetical protein